MITYKKGDILSVTSGVIVHGVNCQNSFGSGLAGQISKKYPYAKTAYHECERKILGTCHSTLVSFEPKLYIVHAFTQEFYGYDGKRYANLAAIAKCLDWTFKAVEYYNKNFDPIDVHTVKIGTGLGGLSWEKEVKPLYEEFGLEYNFTVWEP